MIFCDAMKIAQCRPVKPDNNSKARCSAAFEEILQRSIERADTAGWPAGLLVKQ